MFISYFASVDLTETWRDDLAASRLIHSSNQLYALSLHGTCTIIIVTIITMNITIPTVIIVIIIIKSITSTVVTQCLFRAARPTTPNALPRYKIIIIKTDWKENYHYQDRLVSRSTCSGEGSHTKETKASAENELMSYSRGVSTWSRGWRRGTPRSRTPCCRCATNWTKKIWWGRWKRLTLWNKCSTTFANQYRTEN